MQQFFKVITSSWNLIKHTYLQFINCVNISHSSEYKLHKIVYFFKSITANIMFLKGNLDSSAPSRNANE